MKEKELVFIYGSLKKGFVNHSFMKDATLVGSSLSVHKLGMFKDPFGNWPYLTMDPLNYIKGELYEVNQELLIEIDEFEGAPEYYHRKKMLVMCNGSAFSAWIYFTTNEKSGPVEEALYEWIE